MPFARASQGEGRQNQISNFFQINEIEEGALSWSTTGEQMGLMGRMGLMRRMGRGVFNIFVPSVPSSLRQLNHNLGARKPDPNFVNLEIWFAFLPHNPS
jgi:hypothetical protein